MARDRADPVRQPLRSQARDSDFPGPPLRAGRQARSRIRSHRPVHRPLRHRPDPGRRGHGAGLHRGGPPADRHRRAPPGAGGAVRRPDPRQDRGGGQPAQHRGNDDGPAEDAGPPDPLQPGPRDQPQGESGPAGRRRGRGGGTGLLRAGDHGRRLPLRPLQRPGPAHRFPDRPGHGPDPVRRGGGPQPEAGPGGPDHLRRDPLRLRHPEGFPRRRRHPLVEGLPGLGLRLPRHQGAVYLRDRLGGAHGPRRSQVHALPGSPLPDGHQGGRFPGRAERLHQLHRPARVPAGRRSGECWPKT